jgi:hypothetical protein
MEISMFAQLTNDFVNSSMLVLEAQEVMSLRIAKLLGGGPDVLQESNLMVTEKVIAFSEATMAAAVGQSADSIVSAYRDKASANLLRLS